MTEVAWLLQTASDLPLHNEWLSSAERQRLAGLKVPKRRRDWLLGRWAAKRALAAYRPETLAVRPLSDLEIRNAADGSPQAACSGRSLAVALALTHRSHLAVCALAEEGAAIGCDLERLEPRTKGLLEDFFTREERALVEGADGEEAQLLANLIWSAKESALKAMRTGLRADTRKVAIVFPDRDGDDGWWPVAARHQDSGREFTGWWREFSDCVLTILASPPAGVPRELLP